MKPTKDMKQRAKVAYNARAEGEAEDHCYAVALDEAITAALADYELGFALTDEEREAMTSGDLPTWTCICRLREALDRAQRTLTRLELQPAEPQPDAPTDIAALPAYWDERRRKQGKEDKSRCAAELRIALEEGTFPCSVHADAVHGGEAEELRKGIEKLEERYRRSADITIEIDVVADALRRLLDDVDARDSLAYLERKDARGAAVADPNAYSDAQVQAAWEAYESSLCKRPADRNSALREALAAAGVPVRHKHHEYCDNTDELNRALAAVSELETELAEAQKPRAITDQETIAVYNAARLDWTREGAATGNIRRALEALALPAAPSGVELLSDLREQQLQQLETANRTIASLKDSVRGLNACREVLESRSASLSEDEEQLVQNAEEDSADDPREAQLAALCAIIRRRFPVSEPAPKPETVADVIGEMRASDASMEGTGRRFADRLEAALAREVSRG